MTEALIEMKINQVVPEDPLLQSGVAIPIADIMPILENNIEPNCRICRNGVQIEGEIPTPLISPCLCIGYVHKKCIINYLNDNPNIISCQSCNYEYNITYDYYDKHGKINFWDLFSGYMLIEILLLGFSSSFLLLLLCSGTGFDNSGLKFLYCFCFTIGELNLVWLIMIFFSYNHVKLYYKKLFGYKNKLYFGLYIFFGFFFQMAYESISTEHTKVINICEIEQD